jgi:hypothetical protein
MEMRNDKARDSPSVQWTGDHLLPHLTSCRVVNSGVEDGPTVTIVNYVDVYMIEPKRQGNARPENAGYDFRDAARFRGRRKWKGQLSFDGARNGMQGLIRSYLSVRLRRL